MPHPPNRLRTRMYMFTSSMICASMYMFTTFGSPACNLACASAVAFFFEVNCMEAVEDDCWNSPSVRCPSCGLRFLNRAQLTIHERVGCYESDNLEEEEQVAANSTLFVNSPEGGVAAPARMAVAQHGLVDDRAAEIEKVVPPGGTTKLNVQWRGKGDGGPFRQQASVLTNDPQRPQIAFVVEGRVVPTYKAVPPSVTLPKLSSSSSQQASVTFFTFGREQPTIDALSVTEEKTAQFYSLTSSPLEPAELTAEAGATGGFRITADIRPGLPIGTLRQTIKVVFRMPEEVTAEIPVEGSVSGDLALAGKAWDSSREVLLLGTVSSRTGDETSLFVTVKGSHRADVKLEVREIVPNALKVVVGEGKPVGSGNVIRIPLSITIPPGSPPANHICSEQAPAGKIVLDTGHPDSPTLTIPVCIAIVP